MQICPVGAKMFHVDRWMDRDMTKLIVSFHNCANAPRNYFQIGQTEST